MTNAKKIESCHPDSENQRLTENSVSLFLLVEHKWNTFGAHVKN